MGGYAGIGRQAWLRAKWVFPVRVRVSLAAPSVCETIKKRLSSDKIKLPNLKNEITSEVKENYLN